MNATRRTCSTWPARAGLAVLWLDNRAGWGACARVPNAMATEGAPAALCSDGECLDEALLHGLNARIAARPPSAVRAACCW